MLSKSDGHLSTGLLERPPSGVNPAASIMAQPVQLVQAVPVLPSFYQSGVPVVMRQIPRMPMTVLPQPMTVSHQPSATGSKFCHPISNCRNLVALIIYTLQLQVNFFAIIIVLNFCCYYFGCSCPTASSSEFIP